MKRSFENPIAVHFPSATLCLTSKATSSSLSLAHVAAYSHPSPLQPLGKVYELEQPEAEDEEEVGAPAGICKVRHQKFQLALIICYVKGRIV